LRAEARHLHPVGRSEAVADLHSAFVALRGRNAVTRPLGSPFSVRRAQCGEQQRCALLLPLVSQRRERSIERTLPLPGRTAAPDLELPFGFLESRHLFPRKRTYWGALTSSSHRFDRRRPDRGGRAGLGESRNDASSEVHQSLVECRSSAADLASNRSWQCNQTDAIRA
jgi:hypothetical protein